MNKRRNFVYSSILAATVAIAGQPPSAGAASAEASIAKGNKAFEQQDYGRALLAYEEARKATPQSPEVLFNIGTAQYRLKNYTKAAETFEQAARAAGDSRELAAEALHNRGNAFYQQAQELVPQDPQQALAGFQQSEASYIDALDVKPLAESAQNLELTRMAIKQLSDALERQKQQRQQQQEQGKQQEAQQQLNSLRQDQEKLLQQTQDLDQRREQGESELEEQRESLTREQEGLGERAEELRRQLPEQDSMSSAANEMKKATEALERDNLDAAREAQERAIESLSRAAEDLQKSGGKEAQTVQQQPTPAPSRNSDGQPHDEPAEEYNPMLDEAHRIVEEERARAREEGAKMAAKTSPVDKDW